MFNSRWTCDGKNSLEFERAVVMMHESSLWMIGEEEGPSGDIIDHSSGGEATDAVGQRGVVAATTWAPTRASYCVRETQRKVENGCSGRL
jgi:hypothetical protein